jgi:hypothetical protein
VNTPRSEIAVNETPSSPALPAVEFLYSNACKVHQALHALDESPEIARMARREYWIVLGSSVPVALVIGGMLAFMIAGLSKPDPPWIGIAVGVVVALLATFWNGRHKAWGDYRKSILKNAAIVPNGPREDAKVTVSVGPQGVTFACNGVVTTHEWSHFERVVRAGSFVCVLFAGDWHGTSVPVSAFGSAEEAELWQASVQAMIDERGYGPAARVREFLDATDLKCGACGHPLRGLKDPRCAECGTELFLRRLTAWAALAVPVRDWWFARQT